MIQYIVILFVYGHSKFFQNALHSIYNCGISLINILSTLNKCRGSLVTITVHLNIIWVVSLLMAKRHIAMMKL